MTPKQLAATLLKAMEIREESFDLLAAQEAQETRYAGQRINYSRFYDYSLEEAVELALEELALAKEFSRPIELLLDTSPNDAIEWAESLERRD